MTAYPHMVGINIINFTAQLQDVNCSYIYIFLFYMVKISELFCKEGCVD